MRSAYQTFFKSKSRFRSTFLILTAIALWVSLPYLFQFGSGTSNAQTNNLPDLVAILTAPSASPSPSANSTGTNGYATYDVRTFNGVTIRELIVNVQGVNAMAGTQVQVYLNNGQIGTMTIDMFHRGRLTLSTATPDTTVPMPVSGDTVTVKNGDTTIVSGAFAAPSTPSPTVTPSHSPTVFPSHTPNGTPTVTPSGTPNGTPIPPVRLFAVLNGDAIDGIVPRGNAIYETWNTRRNLNVWVSSVNVPNGTVLSVSLGNEAIGNITIQNRCGSLRLTTDNGGTVPTVTSGAILSVRNGENTVLSGPFSATPPTPTPHVTPSGTPTTTPTPNGTPVPHVPRAFSANLRGQDVVPPVTTNGRGHGFIVLNPAENQIRVHLGYFNLSSAATSVTINGPAMTGENGDVAFTLTNPGGTSGRVMAQTFEVNEEQVEQLRDGLFYFVIKTANNPDGEIRGQIRSLHHRGDFDGDGFADVSVLRSTNSNYTWFTLNSSDATLSVQTMGRAGDINVQADYDGDGMVDLAVFTPSTGTWTINRSATITTITRRFGLNGDTPMVGDYDGDGINDLTVFRPSTGTWYVWRSSDNGYTIMRWGLNGDKPVSGDFDGDGRTDIAVFRPSNGNWYVFKSSTQTMFAMHWGLNGDKPVSGDFNGDGVTDVGVYRPSTGVWYVYNTLDGSTLIRRFGLANDIPVPVEYDGDGSTDIAVYRPSDGNWYIWNSSSDTMTVQRFGLSTDTPSHLIYAP